VILVDSSIWIDHLRQRAHFLAQLQALPQAAVSTHDEALAFVERHSLFGRGVGWADVHLLCATMLEAPAHLWTRDKRLASAAADLGCLHQPPSPSRH
jgi:predicted nucleic acid-binding protein